MSEELERIDWREIPHIRKVGRYTLFGVCAVSVSLVSYVVMRGGLHFGNGAANSGSYAISFIVFMTLRDMSKQWDAVLLQQSRWFRDGHESTVATAMRPTDSSTLDQQG